MENLERQLAQCLSERPESVAYDCCPKTTPSRLHARPQGSFATGVSSGLLAKAVIDRIGGALGLLASLPLILLAAIAIRIDSSGPVFHRQQRCGHNGRTFWMWKLRTMVPDAARRKAELADQNTMSGPVFKIDRDPRVTRVGRLLRRLSIDELPQFWNVLRGEMSLVGPRPPLPEEVEQYGPSEWQRLSVKPGLTCLWQVSGRNHLDWDEWVRLDLEYIRNWSLALDLVLLVRTVPAVLRGDGAS